MIYALFGVLSLSYHACFNSSLSTLEKRFHFSSSTGGYIMITDNVATVLTNLFIGYYGKTAHKPRWMSIGCIVTGLSVMITALPYFIYGPAQEFDLEVAKNMTLLSKSRNNDQICTKTGLPEDCTQISAGNMMTMVAVACFGVSNFFRGFGSSIYFTYGTPYLDDNVGKAEMPTFFAFVFALRILGAPVGFYMSSLFLKFYENPFEVPAGMVEQDPRWIGAWWIGFLVSGTLMLLLAIPLAFFPREFKKKQPANNNNLPETLDLVEGGKRVNGDDRVGGSGSNISDDEKRQLEVVTENNKPPAEEESIFKKMPAEVWAIISNPIIICQMMGNLFRGIGIIGFFVFQTKYLEAQFRPSASKASLVSGTTGFLSKVCGVVLGGMLITLCRPGPRVLTTFIFFVELSSVFALLYGATIMGPQYAYPFTQINEQTGQMELGTSCNKNCFCDQAKYQPVCSKLEMKAYFSPCHAGCKASFATGDNSTVFTDCSCVDSLVKNIEKCQPDTDGLMKYATIIALGGMISGSSRSGNMVTFFRSISQDQKSLAVAVGSFWHSLFVSIPYPLIYGKIFDFCCWVWSSECGERGNCWLYDTEKLRYVYHAVSIALIAMGSVFDLIMIFLSPRLGNLYDDQGSGGRKLTLKQRLFFWRSAKKEGVVLRPVNGTTRTVNDHEHEETTTMTKRYDEPHSTRL